MQRLFFFILLLSLLSTTTIHGEVIVQDSLDNLIGLPLDSNSSDTGGFTNLATTVTTSPYTLNVSINDIIELGFTAPAFEGFFINQDGFGGSTLIFSAFSPASSPGTVLIGTPPSFYLGPNNTIKGVYTFIFTIPVNTTLILHMDYRSYANPVLNDTILIEMFNPIIGGNGTGNNGSHNTGINGDPLFVGWRGQSYQIHGIDKVIYNIISEKDTQVNGRFVYLDQGKCPNYPTPCWSHKGSYIGELSIQAIVQGINHKVLIIAGPAEIGFQTVIVDNVPGILQDVSYIDECALSPSFDPRYPCPMLRVQHFNPYHITVTTSHFIIDITNSDGFVNQGISLRVPLSVLEESDTHGLLGISWRRTKNRIKDILPGDIDDYSIEGLDDIHGTSFVYNRFMPNPMVS